MSTKTVSEIKLSAERTADLEIDDDNALEWVTLGQLEIAGQVHPSWLSRLQASALLPDGGTLSEATEYIVVPNNFLHPVSGALVAAGKSIPLTLVDYKEFQDRCGYGYKGLAINSLITSEYGGVLYFNPAVPADAIWQYRLRYVKYPTDLAEISDTIDLEGLLIPLLVDYLILRAKQNDEEFEEYASLVSKFQTDLKKFQRPK